MGRTLSALLVAAPLALLAPAAAAIDYNSVAVPSILYDAPSGQGRKLFIIRAGTPVEVVFSQDKWAKVRDPSGALAWIERAALAQRRTVLVTAERATVLRDANAASPEVFIATRDLVLDYLDTHADGWVQVRHADGARGYLRPNEVWGL
jgi:SH3-like domain-containing protein